MEDANIQAIATPQVQQGAESAAVDIGHSGHAFDMVSLFMQADLVVKLVILLLLLASIWCWKIIADKYFSHKSLGRRMRKFESQFWSSGNLDDHYDHFRGDNDTPHARIFTAGMGEYLRECSEKERFSDPAARAAAKERVKHALHIVCNREVSQIEGGIGFLATIGSAAPFIGLFGTVWGIMNSFTSIGFAKNTSLAVVAPGIAEALFATSIGLLAAIPAVIFYNKLANSANQLADRVYDYTDEIGVIFDRKIDHA